jgi:hypothetical protein
MLSDYDSLITVGISHRHISKRDICSQTNPSSTPKGRVIKILRTY